MIPCAALLVIVCVLRLSTVSGEIFRLPEHIKPIRYHLTLEPTVNSFSEYQFNAIPYHGEVTMELEVVENTRNITFNKKKLEINDSSICVTSKEGETLEVEGTYSDSVKEMYVIQMKKELVKHEVYNLTIHRFDNNLSYDGLGFFHAFNWVKNNETGEQERRIALATHFQPCGARIAFPCFDEPALKASFIVTLIRPEGYTSISNEALESTEDLGDGRFKDTFKETPVMSTYTLAFAVTEYSHTSSGKYTIFAESSFIEAGYANYALEISPKTLKALEDFTGVKYVIDKMDQLAVPDSYFRYHAMENWGLVIYGQTHLLRTKDDSDEDYKRTTCYIAHEFAHQWFGNLVTPAWWDYIWIGESFAAYFQHHTAAVVQPTWNLKEQFLIDVVHESFHKEETGGAYPLNYEIQYSGQYPPFHIMYEKGSTIIRMMEHFLSQNVFKKGLNIYLTKNKFKAALPSDLYDAFQEAVDTLGSNHILNHMTVKEIMKTWDSTKGYPIVTATRDYTTGSIKITQKSKFDNETKWIIPINFVSSADTINFVETVPTFWLTDESASLGNFSTDGWIIINIQQTGYYRVNYDLENWARIIEFMNSDRFRDVHVLNRAQVLEDAYYFASIGELPWDIPLRLGEYVKREKDYIGIATFVHTFSNYHSNYWYSRYVKARESQIFQNHTLMNMVDADATEFDLQKAYLKSTLTDITNDLGTKVRDNDSYLDKLTRETVMKYRNFYLNN